MNPIQYQAKEGFIMRVIAGETLLVPIGERTKEFNGMITLNETGAFLWKHLQAPVTIDVLTDLMAQEFDASATEIHQDIEEYISYLQSQDLISSL